MDFDETVKKRTITTEVKGEQITFDEYYKIDPVTGEEVFDRELELFNDSVLYDEYKNLRGLLTNDEIKNIRKKYGMNQKEYALALGVGEVTVNRFEKGAIQTDATDAIMRLSENPENMYDLLIKNQKNFKDDDFERFISKVKELILLKKHKVIDLKAEEFVDCKFKTGDIMDVADYIIDKYNQPYEKLRKDYDVDVSLDLITPLKLQKLLYYVQGLALCLFDMPAFSNKIVAWEYGPVVEEVYYKFKNNGKSSIITDNKNIKISKGLMKVIDLIVEGYGKFDAGCLINLTHEETPWIITNKDEEISQKVIKEYFELVYKR